MTTTATTTTTARTVRQSVDMRTVRVVVRIVHHHSFLQSVGDETSFAKVSSLHAFDDVQNQFPASGVVLSGGGAAEVFERFQLEGKNKVDKDRDEVAQRDKKI